MPEAVSAVASFQKCSSADARHLVDLIARDAEVAKALFEALGAEPVGTLAGGAPKAKATAAGSSGRRKATAAADAGIRQVLARVISTKHINAGDISDLRRELEVSGM